MLLPRCNLSFNIGAEHHIWAHHLQGLLGEGGMQGGGLGGWWDGGHGLGIGRWGRAWEEELILLVLKLGLEAIDQRSRLGLSMHHCWKKGFKVRWDDKLLDLYSLLSWLSILGCSVPCLVHTIFLYLSCISIVYFIHFVLLCPLSQLPGPT